MSAVLIYGDLWTDCCAMEAIVRRYTLENVSVCESVSALMLSLSQSPYASVILCLRPHEHVYLFYRLRRWLNGRKVLVVTDRMYYTDRCVMQYFGLREWMERDELLPFISRGQTGNQVAEAWIRFRRPGEACRVSQLPDIAEEGGKAMADSILFRLNMYVRWNLPSGVSDSKYALLLLLTSGCPAVLLAKQVRMQPKTVSIYRRQAMARLNMKSCPVSLYRGLRLLSQLQRTPLMLAEGNLSEKTGVMLTAGERNY
ncbi:TPA: transcriptional regulator [Salmonella enterica]|uniref:transcriptional regulator n=1 Tax=Salmonella enterica TaxID=28901 RepID=UPI00198279BB|nr:transcriptional regulator [Salmonella enterica]MDL2989156.1 transcriptional regulator [Salmonella enterica]HAK6771614.1 transcriptional regulator [Salmonella enterica]HAK6818097.1 transcriptional regulator [Salmonella enterica]